MTKLVTVVTGAVFGAVVTVDLRPGCAVPVAPGICHGFQAAADGWTGYCYCFDREWQLGMEGISVNAFDPALAIAWPLGINPTDRSLVSAKDAALPMLSEATRA